MLTLWREERKREACLGSTSTGSTNETNEVEEDLGLCVEPMEDRGSR